MAWSVEQLEALERAIASGKLSVQYQDRRVTYNSISEMLVARRLLRKELGLDGADQGLGRDVKITSDKGLG